MISCENFITPFPKLGCYIFAGSVCDMVLPQDVMCMIYVIYAMIMFCNVSRLAYQCIHNRQEPYGCLYNFV
jgi:hypothetical protein